MARRSTEDYGHAKRSAQGWHLAHPPRMSLFSSALALRMFIVVLLLAMKARSSSISSYNSDIAASRTGKARSFVTSADCPLRVTSCRAALIPDPLAERPGRGVRRTAFHLCLSFQMNSVEAD